MSRSSPLRMLLLLLADVGTASGSREFILGYGDVQGYVLTVYCDESSYC